MRFKKWNSNSGQGALVGLLIALAMGCLLYFVYLKPHQQTGVGTGAVQDAARDAGIDTSSRLSTYQSMTTQIQAINEKNKNRGQDLMKEIEAMQK